MSEEEARVAVVDALRRCADALERGHPLRERGFLQWRALWQSVADWCVFISVDVSPDEPDDD